MCSKVSVQAILTWAFLKISFIGKLTTLEKCMAICKFEFFLRKFLLRTNKNLEITIKHKILLQLFLECFIFCILFLNTKTLFFTGKFSLYMYYTK